MASALRMGTLLILSLMCASAEAQESRPASVEAPTPNRADEPRIAEYSLDTAVAFLDQAAVHWTTSRQCFTCHTNYAYLLARPTVTASVIAHDQVRASLEELVDQRWPDKGPRWDAEVVMSAAVLAINDSATTGTLHATTRTALDRMWTVQRDDGGINWLKCGWPPMESDDDFGVAMMLIAAGAAPDDYRRTESAAAGIARLRTYLDQHPAPTLHHRAMLLWADSYLGDLLTAETRNDVITELLRLQKNDGGWNLATLGSWARSDDLEQDVTSSDGYATGFVIYVLRRAGIPADDDRLQQGIQWLKSNQRASGRWYTRSLNKDSSHFISHAGTAFAVMALTACDARPDAH